MEQLSLRHGSKEGTTHRIMGQMSDAMLCCISVLFCFITGAASGCAAVCHHVGLVGLLTTREDLAYQLCWCTACWELLYTSMGIGLVWTGGTVVLFPQAGPGRPRVDWK